MNEITISYLNGNTGFAENVRVVIGTTVISMLRSVNPGFDGSKYNIRVNGNAVNAEYVLRNSDTVICVPRNIKGA